MNMQFDSDLQTPFERGLLSSTEWEVSSDFYTGIEITRHRKPVLVRGFAKHWPAIRKWT